MKRVSAVVIVVLVVMTSWLSACAPKTALTPLPSPPTAAPPPASTPGAAATPSPADAEWAGVVRAAQREGKLVLYDATFFVGDIRTATAKAFQERYGIPMEILVTGGSSATVEKLQVEQKMGVSVADVFAAGSLSGPRMVSLGFARPIAAELPALKTDAGQFTMAPIYSPGGEALTFAYQLIGVGANSKLVQPGEIKSYKDLMNPKYKGKIVMRDPRLGSGGTPLNLGTLRYVKAVDDSFLSGLVKQQVVMWGGGENEVPQMVARGEYAVDLGAALGLLYAPLIRDGAPVMPVYMEEGTVVMPSLILASKSAPHPNAARVFINWLLSPEGQTVYHKADASTPMRKDVPDFLPEGMRREPVKKFLPTSWEATGAINKMIADKDFENLFGKR